MERDPVHLFVGVYDSVEAAERIEQVFPSAEQRIANILDVDKDDFAAALRQAKEEG